MVYKGRYKIINPGQIIMADFFPNLKKYQICYFSIDNIRVKRIMKKMDLLQEYFIGFDIEPEYIFMSNEAVKNWKKLV